MKLYNLSAFVFASLLLVAPCANSKEQAPTIVANPSFEALSEDGLLPDGWKGDSEVYSQDATVSRTGKASLKYNNDDPERYRTCRQTIHLEPLKKYHFGVYVKTENLQGDGPGVRICLEWKGEDDEYLGGVYPRACEAVSDWTLIEHFIRPPEKAHSVSLACFVKKGMTGTVWFDDVFVDRIEDRMSSVMLSPVYRGLLLGENPDPVRIRVKVPDIDLADESLRLQTELKGSSGSVILPLETVCPGDSYDVDIPVKTLSEGQHEITLRLLTSAGEKTDSTTHSITRMTPDYEPRCWIDDHRRLIVDGKPFFPIGTYWGGINEEDLKVYSDSKFNCIMPYPRSTKEQMDLAHRYGIKVMYSVKDFYAGTRYCPETITTLEDEESETRAKFREFRDHPALLAWYLNDELPQMYMDRLVTHYQWLLEEDPEHPGWAVLNEIDEISDYIETFDVVGTDPYPIGRKTVTAALAAEWAQKTYRGVEGARAMWQVPQIFKLGYESEENPDYRTPTYDEMRSMAWQSICEGATGIVFYAYFAIKRGPDVPFETQWERVKKIAAEIDEATPTLLSIDPVPEIEVVCDPPEPTWLNWTARSHEGELTIFAVNNGDGEGRAVFSLPGGFREVTTRNKQKPLENTGSEFEDHFKKFDLRIYEIKM